MLVFWWTILLPEVNRDLVDKIWWSWLFLQTFPNQLYEAVGGFWVSEEKSYDIKKLPISITFDNILLFLFYILYFYFIKKYILWPINPPLFISQHSSWVYKNISEYRKTQFNFFKMFIKIIMKSKFQFQNFLTHFNKTHIIYTKMLWSNDNLWKNVKNLKVRYGSFYNENTNEKVI